MEVSRSFLGGERWGITEFLERKDEKVAARWLTQILCWFHEFIRK